MVAAVKFGIGDRGLAYAPALAINAGRLIPASENGAIIVAAQRIGLGVAA
jgi:hypothetical protein